MLLSILYQNEKHHSKGKTVSTGTDSGSLEKALLVFWSKGPILTLKSLMAISSGNGLKLFPFLEPGSVIIVYSAQ
jgi:hypothetical protein